MVPKGRNLKRVLVGITRPNPKKSTGMGWVGFVSEFHGYFWLGYTKRLVILVVLGIKPVGKIPALI